MLIGAGIVMLLSLGLTAVAYLLGHTPELPREHCFEDGVGKQDNPFADLSAGAANSQLSCRECGDAVAFPSYRVCQTCLTRTLPTD